MPKTHRYRLRIALAIICLGLTATHQAYSQGDQHTIVYRSISTDNLPRVEYIFNVLDGNGTTAEGITKDEVKLTVNNEDVLGPTDDLTRVSLPLAVAFVVDISPSMGEINTPPNRTRYRDAIDTINSIRKNLPDKSTFSLITFDSKVTTVIENKADKNAILNALPLNPSAEADSAGFPITEAIIQALETLKDQREYAPVLFILSAGRQGVEIDENAINSMLLTMTKNPPQISFIHYGSDQEGQYVTFPANKASVERAASSLRAAFISFYSTDLLQVTSIYDALDQRLGAIVQNSRFYMARFEVARVKPGDNIFTLNVRDSISDEIINVPSMPPIIKLDIATTTLSSSVPLKTAVIFNQHPIEKMEYFLDNRLISSSDNAESGFLQNIDASSLSQFKNDTDYKLFAAVTYDDQGDTKTARSQPLTVRVAAPIVAAAPPSQPLALWLAGGAVALLGLAAYAFFIRFQRRTVHSGPVTGTRTLNGGNQYDSNAITNDLPYSPEDQDTDDIADEDEATRDFDTEEQEEYADLWLEYSEGGHSSTARLKRHITMIGRSRGTDVRLENTLVTREHAKITISLNEIQITDLGSKHGIFIQSHAPKNSDRRISVRQDVPIGINECFWIGREIKAVIRSDSGDKAVWIDT
jgi:hypothetical protein